VLEYLRIAEEEDFYDIVISMKASHVGVNVAANRLLALEMLRRAKAEGVPVYPLHLGVTEAGTPRTGILRSAVGIGTLLAEGIGDTIRVSLTGDPVEEIHAGFEILKTLRFREHGLTIISCPTCGRLQTNLVSIVEEVERSLSGVKKPITVAIMGCAVNGPGEAREADIGVACGKKSALLFKKGQVIRKLQEKEIVRTLIEEVTQWDG
jgi:(E)-4-hydroxy-3-methylbut-2-enyl-diphosphate synthase